MEKADSPAWRGTYYSHNSDFFFKLSCFFLSCATRSLFARKDSFLRSFLSPLNESILIERRRRSEGERRQSEFAESGEKKRASIQAEKERQPEEEEQEKEEDSLPSKMFKNLSDFSLGKSRTFALKKKHKRQERERERERERGREKVRRRKKGRKRRGRGEKDEKGFAPRASKVMAKVSFLPFFLLPSNGLFRSLLGLLTPVRGRSHTITLFLPLCNAVM